MTKGWKIVAVATMALTAACATPPPQQQILRYRMPEGPPNLDPFRGSDDNSNVYLYPLFDGLVEYVPATLDVRPAVAESWSVSEDGLTYSFKLRKGVRFHNGREVTVDDVVYSVRRALSKKAKSQKGYFFASVKGSAEFAKGETADLSGISAPDPETVVFTLSHPYEKFLTVLASEGGSILPREVYDDPAEGYLKHPVGCGPFKFESWDEGVSLTLSRFAGHWKGAPPPGALQEIVFKFIFDSNTAMEEYRSGGLDFTQEIPPGQRQKVMREMPEDFHTWTRFSILYLGFNHLAPVIRDNALVRKALIHAIDRSFIVRVLDEGKDTVAAGVIPPGMLGHEQTRVPAAYDPDLAARLLAQAGYPGGKGLPPLVYLSNDTRGFRNVADRIQADLARVGVKVEMKWSDFGAFLAAMSSGAGAKSGISLFRMTWYADWPDPDNFLAAQFATGADGNFGLYHNPRFDRLMEEARHEPDTAKRASLYREADTMLIEDAALVPIYWYGQDVLLKPEFTGLKPSLLGVFGIAWEEVTRRR